MSKSVDDRNDYGQLQVDDNRILTGGSQDYRKVPD